MRQIETSDLSPALSDKHAYLLRPAVHADAPAIARLLRHVWRVSLPYLPVLHTPDEDVAFIADILMPRAGVTLAEGSVGVVGFCAVSEGWIEQLYIHPQAQRQGLGGRFVALAKSNNHQLDLWTFQRNQPAIAFYARHGFIEVRRTDGDNEEREPDLLMRWQAAS